MSDDELSQRQIKPLEDSSHRRKTLKDYKWKPGFEQFPADESDEEIPTLPKKELKLVESKEKPEKKRWPAVIRHDGLSFTNQFKEHIDR